MATDIVMPRLSDSMEEGTILKWMKAVGDEVAVGDELVEIETDKANMVYESDAAGTLVEIIAGENDTLPIGEVIARVGEEGEKPSGDGKPEPSKQAEEEKPRAAEDTEPTRDPAAPGGAAQEAAGNGLSAEAAEREEADVGRSGGSAEAGESDGRVKASPLARRIAGEQGIDLGRIEGSGPGGRIVKADVERAAESGAAAEAPAAAPSAEPPPAPAGLPESPETAKGQTTTQDLTKLQQVVARRMAESKATAPHFYLNAEIDMSRCVEARARIKAAAGEGEVVPSFNDMVIKASALALREFPRANGAYRDGRFELYSRVNVGIAVAGQDALVVPTIFDADRKGLRQIASDARALAARVREGQITPPELSGGTFTVSNLGMFGIDSFSAVINSPQAGILAVGAIKERPVVRDGEIGTAHLMSVTLACDHRILYGADGAEFLARIRALLEEPVSLAL
jgi:pyruvate dehydrogenase E2 component (dihydrolipoamide acetyltransferase)